VRTLVPFVSLPVKPSIFSERDQLKSDSEDILIPPDSSVLGLGMSSRNGQHLPCTGDDFWSSFLSFVL